MKKLISVVLAVIMTLTCAVPAFAAGTGVEDIPIILLYGDGTQIYVPDENAENGERNIWGDAFKSIEGGNIGASVANVLIPFLTEGLLFDKWDNYYDAFYEEIAPIFEEMRLDGDGNPRYNSGLGKEDIQSNISKKSQNPALWQGGRYDAFDYSFRYDWRLAPEEVAEELHLFIGEVIETTGKNQVTLAANCLGGCFIMAYLSKYGDDGHIKNVIFNSTVANGTEALTDAFCGDIEIDAQAIQRFAHQGLETDESFLYGVFAATTEMVDEMIFTSYDLLAQVGVIDRLGMSFDQLYQKLYEGLVPRLAIAVFATFPGYWAAIEAERYSEAKAFVFGQKGDELYDEYAGLIAKLDSYYLNVGSRKLEIINECKNAGVHFGAIAKYGTQIYPFIKRQNNISDDMVGLTNASFGATTAKDVYSTFSSSYLAQAAENGTDKYISPDKQVDASTSIFADSLWIEKNVAHAWYKFDYQLIEEFSRNTKFTVNSDPRYPQYMIYIPGTQLPDPEGGLNGDTGDIVPMTEENCHLTLWDSMPQDSKQEPTLKSRLMALFRWLEAIFKYIRQLFGAAE